MIVRLNSPLLSEALQRALEQETWDSDPELHDIEVRDFADKDTSAKSVVLVPESHDSRVLARHIGNGCRGFVSHGDSISDLVEAIESVSKGQACCSRSIMGTAFTELAEAERRGNVVMNPVLTKRQLELLSLVFAGLQNKQIAKKLRISIYTVKNHMHAILEKLECKSRDEAARLAVKNGWI